MLKDTGYIIHALRYSSCRLFVKKTFNGPMLIAFHHCSLTLHVTIIIFCSFDENHRVSSFRCLQKTTLQKFIAVLSSVILLEVFRQSEKLRYPTFLQLHIVDNIYYLSETITSATAPPRPINSCRL